MAAVVGIVVCIPLRNVAGGWLWNLFAEQIYERRPGGGGLTEAFSSANAASSSAPRCRRA